jgi:hypothetical protein
MVGGIRFWALEKPQCVLKTTLSFGGIVQFSAKEAEVQRS